MKLWLFVVFVIFTATPSRAAEIDWAVKDRFRLFNEADEASRAKVDALLSRLADPGRLADSYAGLLATLHGRGAASLRTSNWDQRSRTYPTGYLYPETYTITARLSGAPAGTSCTWSVNGIVVEASSCEGAELKIPARSDESRWGGRGTVEVRASDGSRAAAPIAIRDQLIVAMGDSFISGEGNPDVPADWSQLPASRRLQKVQWPASINPDRHPVRTAQWWDEPCHRSLLSWPVLASLKKAAQNNQEAVTFVHVGCSGATVHDGLVGLQESLPGCPKGIPKSEWRTCHSNRDEHSSQFDQVERLLAASPTRRPIDKVHMSIGGNDVGFGGVIAYAALPPNGYVLGPIGPALLPLGFEVVCPYNAEAYPLALLCWAHPSAEQRFNDLQANYDEVAKAFRRLGVAPEAVIHTTYPDVLSAGEGTYCHHAVKEEDLPYVHASRREAERSYLRDHPLRERPNGFEALQSVIPAVARGFQKWNFQFAHPAGAGCDPYNPTRKDSEVCKANWVRASLNRHIEIADQKHKWKTIMAHEKEISGHGWCMGGPAHPLALPVSIPDGDGWKWSNRNLSLFDAYDGDRPRWFRTANDSLLSQFGGTGRLIQGSIHPTFRSHVAYAEAVVAEAN